MVQAERLGDAKGKCLKSSQNRASSGIPKLGWEPNPTAGAEGYINEIVFGWHT